MPYIDSPSKSPAGSESSSLSKLNDSSSSDENTPSKWVKSPIPTSILDLNKTLQEDCPIVISSSSKENSIPSVASDHSMNVSSQQNKVLNSFNQLVSLINDKK